MQKFVSSLTQTAQQVATSSGLHIPDDSLLALFHSGDSKIDVNQALKVPEILKSCETLAEEWVDTISTTLQKEVKKQPLGNVRCVCYLENNITKVSCSYFRAPSVKLIFGAIALHLFQRSTNP